MYKIIGVLGPKGGVGKTSILFSIIALLNQRKYKVLVVDTDSSSVSLSSLIVRSKIAKVPNCMLLKLNINHVVEYIENNKGSLNYYDYIAIDFKGEEIEQQIFNKIVTLTNFIIIPFVPSYASINAQYSIIQNLISSNVSYKSHVFFNLLGSKINSIYYKEVRKSLEEQFYKYDLHIVKKCILEVIDMDSKDVKKSNILFNKQNKEVLINFVENHICKNEYRK